MPLKHESTQFQGNFNIASSGFVSELYLHPLACFMLHTEAEENLGR